MDGFPRPDPFAQGNPGCPRAADALRWFGAVAFRRQRGTDGWGGRFSSIPFSDVMELG